MPRTHDGTSAFFSDDGQVGTILGKIPTGGESSKVCDEIHQAAERAVSASSTESSATELQAAVRKAVWNVLKVASDVIRGVSNVFDETEFRWMPYKRATRLHQPKTWTSYQLAVALLSLENNLEFRSMQSTLFALGVKSLHGKSKGNNDTIDSI